MEPILELLKVHWPIISSAFIVPGLRWVKNKAKTDWPILWWAISIFTSVGLAVGGSDLVGADQATTQFNALVTAALTQLIHTGKKTAEKVNGS